MLKALLTRLWCERVTPLGLPVVPEVNCKRVISMVAQNILKPHYDALQDRVWKNTILLELFWNLDVASIIHPDLVGQLVQHLGRGRACAAHHILEPKHCHEHNLSQIGQYFD